MAQFDPALRLEWWQFQQIGEQYGQPVYRRLKFNMVAYDNQPERYVEPVSVDEQGEQAFDFQTRAQQPARIPRVAGFEFHNGRPYSVVSFDDNLDLSAG